MGVYTDIEAALNSRLNSLASHPPIAWPNVRYNPSEGTTYLRPTVLPAQSGEATLDGHTIERGIYQIDIYVPLEKGISTITTWMDNIRSHFPIGTNLTAGSSIIFIKNPRRSEFTREENWFSGYISFNYICYS
jgi:hypothetical protein